MNIFDKIRRKRLSTSEQVRLMFRDAFDDAVKSKETRSQLTGNSMSDGMVIYAAIAITYKELKDSKNFQTVCALTALQHNFNPQDILDEELRRALKKYCGINHPSDNLY